MVFSFALGFIRMMAAFSDKNSITDPTISTDTKTLCRAMKGCYDDE